MPFTIERLIDYVTVERFLPLYTESFEPLAELSAQKQLLTNTEFSTLLSSSSTLKFCGWTDTNELAALAVVATDLSMVPWLSEPFFKKEYPDEYARGALGCVMTILVVAEHRDKPWIVGIVQTIGAHMLKVRGVALFDCCKYNIEVLKFPELIASITEDWMTFEPKLLDYQNYYGFTSISAGTIDLREFGSDHEIDLRVHESPSSERLRV